MTTYTEGICGDGVVILRDGVMMTISEVLAALNKAAPAPPVVEVTDDVAKAVLMEFSAFPVRLRNAWTGHDMIAAVQSILGPTLGMVTRESADREIAALRELLTEARDCVASCLNAEENQRYSRAERVNYYAGLLAQVDAARGEAG